MQLVTLIASATILAPLGPRNFDARLRLVMALLSLDNHAARIITPGYPRCLPLKSASVIAVVMVTASAVCSLPFQYCSPENVSEDNALLSEGILGDISRYISEYLLALWKEGSDPIIPPDTPRALPLKSASVMVVSMVTRWLQFSS
jgi:hypothetical protein